MTKSPEPGKLGTPKRIRPAHRRPSPGQHLTPQKTLTPKETQADKASTPGSTFSVETPGSEAAAPPRDGVPSEGALGTSQNNDSTLEEAPEVQSVWVLLAEQPPGHREATLKVGNPREEASSSGDGAHPVKLTPHTQESSAVHSPATLSPTDKSDNSIVKLAEEVKTLKTALELMGEQME